MKEIEFRASLKEDSKMLPVFKDSFSIDRVNGFFNFSKISVKTDISNHPCVPPEVEDELKDFLGLNMFLLVYLWNILQNNGAAEVRKPPPYDVRIKTTIDFEEKKYQLYIFLDDKIFGIVVGMKFKNILSLIKTLFPIFAKGDFVNEVRFFPTSRY